MAFDPEDLLVPEGQLNEKWFAGWDHDMVVAFLDGAVNDIASEISGLDSATQLKAQNFWGYAQGFLYIATDLASKVGTTQIPNEILKTTTREGPDFFSNRATYYLNQYAAIVPTGNVIQRPKSTWLSATFRP